MAAKPFTGRHAFLVIAGGFAVAFAVNGTMAWLAAANRPGLVVEDSYVASQHFNEGLAAGKAQQALGWKLDAHLRDGMLELAAADSLARPLAGLESEVTITHPYGSAAGETLFFRAAGDGSYVAGPIPPGRWVVEIRSRRGGQQHYLKMRLEPEKR